MMFGNVTFANLQTTAKQAYIYDLSSNTVMLDKNSDSKMYPASMTKVMTVYLLLERLQNGSLSMHDTFHVSKKAWKKGGSKMFVRQNTRISISDLLRGVIVQSGNDAAIIIAEGIAETESLFAALMNKKAIELGMVNTHFVNSTGWPDKNHYTTAKDLAILAQKLIFDFTEYYPMWSEKSFKYAGIKQYNRNPLLFKNIGADGLKTGHTKDAGYGLTSSFKIKDRRIIMILNGMRSKKERIDESVRLAKTSLHDYKVATLIKAGMVFGNVPVAMANVKFVPLVSQNTIRRTIKITSINKIKSTIEYMSPLKTPIKKGSIIGRVIMTIPNEDPITMPLYAGANVGRPNIFKRIYNKFIYVVWGGI